MRAPSKRRTKRRTPAVVAGLVLGVGAAQAAPAEAHLMSPPYRPNGLTELNSYLGSRCTAASYGAQLYMPHVNDTGPGYVKYNGYLWKAADNVRHMIYDHDYKTGAVGRTMWGYYCKIKTGGTTWSTHAWGATFDTNTVTNPFGQTYWNGYANGYPYGNYLPDTYQAANIGNFFWGLNFSGTKDPMHFQYVTGY